MEKDEGGEKEVKEGGEKEVKEGGEKEVRLELTEVDLGPPVPPPKRGRREENQGPKLLSSFSRPEVIYPTEKIESWMTCLKCALVSFNAVIWLVGVALLAVGIWVSADKQFLTLQTNLDMKIFSQAGYILIAVGALVMLVGLCGCYGAAKESICILAVYATVIFILILLEAAAMGIVWSATTNQDTREKLQLRITEAVSNRKENDALSYFINLLQAKLQCCGVTSSSEYGLKQESIPPSCTDEDTGLTFEKGCIDASLDYLKSKAAVIGGISVAILLLQVGALIFTLCLFCGLRQATKSVF